MGWVESFMDGEEVITARRDRATTPYFRTVPLGCNGASSREGFLDAAAMFFLFNQAANQTLDETFLVRIRSSARDGG